MEDVLAVERAGARDGAVAYGGRLRVPPAQAIERLRLRLAPYGYTPFLQRGEGLDWVQALPLAETPPPSNLRVHVLLFVATALTTLLAGAFLSGVAPEAILARPTLVLAGLPFAASLLSILGVHELGHYAVGRWRGMAVSLPYFLPLPPIPGMLMTGTLGAVIRLRGAARDRRALFDMAVAGPLAGLVVAIPVYAIGLRLSKIIRVPEGMAVPGIQLGDSVLGKLIEWAVVGVLPKNAEILLHPVGLAGWFGFLVTVLNLIPAGQLDGGHIVYSLFGRRHALISVCAAGALLVMGVVFWTPTWLVWAFLIVVVMGVHHGPTMDDVTPLGPGRRLLGAAALVILVLLLPPVPLSVH
jgi:membrane-associated protease RseP (regulator of RpoE activity)